MSGRNLAVEKAVEAAIKRVDDFIAGENLNNLPMPLHRRACDELLASQRNSVRLAALCLVFYWLIDPEWDLDSVPVGIRGKYGDKRLAEELTKRNVTLHDNIVAFGENLGWKGNVREFRLSKDPRFSAFLDAIRDAEPYERHMIADYLAQRFAESKREVAPLPPMGPQILSFARAKVLFHSLIDLQTEGHVQQFLIAALLKELRKRDRIEVKTHCPHAADKFDRTAGDIEEFRDKHLLRAYEVTVRDDWENRITNFRGKMDEFGLAKYVIIASNINSSARWGVPAKMALALDEYGRDLAVVDILDVVNFLAAELSAAELRAAVNQGYIYLSDQRLCGRSEFMDAYREVVANWLDEASA